MPIRPAAVADYDAFAALFPELRVDDPVPSLEKFVAELMPTTLVLEHERTVAAYCYFQSLAEEGVVRHLVVAPRLHGRRLGEQLLREVAAGFRRQGLERWSLNVKPDNAPALSLYRRLGLNERHRSVSLRFDWSLAVPRLEHATSVEVTVENEAAVERDQRLARGTCATARALPNRVLRAVQVGDRFVAAAVFVPSFPGAFPFRADSLAAAGSLLGALKPAASASTSYMQTVVEGQPELASAFIAAGATVRLEILNLEGPLPR